MDIEEFEDLVDRFGEDLSQWPHSSREAGAALLRDSPEALEIVEQARQLRALLAPHPSERAPARLVGRITARAAREGVAAGRVGMPWLPCLRVPAQPALLLPLCFLLGLTLSLVPVSNTGVATWLDVPTFFLGCCGDLGRDAANE